MVVMVKAVGLCVLALGHIAKRLWLRMLARGFSALANTPTFPLKGPSIWANPRVSRCSRLSSQSLRVFGF